MPFGIYHVSLDVRSTYLLWQPIRASAIVLNESFTAEVNPCPILIPEMLVASKKKETSPRWLAERIIDECETFRSDSEDTVVRGLAKYTRNSKPRELAY